MVQSNHIVIMANRRPVSLDVRTILYVFMNENVAEIHVAGDQVYRTRMTLENLERELGEGFMKVHRSCLVAVMAIHDVSDKIYLSNGEALNYVVRKKKAIQAELSEKRKNLLNVLEVDAAYPVGEEYHQRYASFDALPIAFTDIEMVFDEKQNAVDWIFRYGNAALARLEKLPLETMIGASFSSLFPNMDEKWLRGYERAALGGETLEIVDYSPEIDTYLDVICFPTTPGHCGCILLNIADMNYAENPGDSQNARLRYLARLLAQLR